MTISSTEDAFIQFNFKLYWSVILYHFIPFVLMMYVFMIGAFPVRQHVWLVIL